VGVIANLQNSWFFKRQTEVLKLKRGNSKCKKDATLVTIRGGKSIHVEKHAPQIHGKGKFSRNQIPTQIVENKAVGLQTYSEERAGRSRKG